MKIVSQLDGAGIFAGPIIADESPLEAGVFLIPGGAVDMPPPVVPDGHFARCKDGNWVFEIIPTPASAEPASTNEPSIDVVAPVSPRQIRMALTRVGLRSAVEVAVAAGDQDLKDWWEFSTSFDRLNSEVIAMGLELGVSDEQLDALWALGVSL